MSYTGLYTTRSGTVKMGEKFGEKDVPYFIRCGMLFLDIEVNLQSDLQHDDVIATGMPRPAFYGNLLISIPAAKGNYQAMIQSDGLFRVYFPQYVTASRIDTCIIYPV